MSQRLRRGRSTVATVLPLDQVVRAGPELAPRVFDNSLFVRLNNVHAVGVS